MRVTCEFCGWEFERAASAANRTAKTGMATYCSLKCSGLARRAYKPDWQKKEEKRAYDAERRKTLAAELKAAKAEYHKRTYDPAKAAEKRKLRMPAHVEYCREPEYKKWKSEYDQKYRAAREYGEFADAFLMLRDIETEILQRMTRYEIYQERGQLNKSTRRKRAAARGTVALS